MHNITYKFADDCPIPELRGLTATGGKFTRVDGQYGKTPDAVKFTTTINGKGIVAKIAGKPELEAALAEHLANEQAVADRLEAIGWPIYQSAQSKVINARAEYDSASEYGYPVKQAKAMYAAEDALEPIAAQYPLAVMYAKAISYSYASNDEKASAGRNAMRKIEQGGDVCQAISEMESDWAEAAQRACDNS